MRLPFFSKKQSGFTLIELLVVIAIIAVLISIGLASYSQAQRSARDTQRKANLRDVAGALEQFYADNNRYPISSATGQISDTVCLPATPAWGNPSFSCGGKTYLSQLPEEPLPSASQYFYQSCSSGQSYALFAVVEGSPGTLPTSPCTVPAGYNYRVVSR